MKKFLGSLSVIVAASLAGCSSNGSEAQWTGDTFILGAATEANIKVQSIRNPDQPNSRGIIGEASGERAVVAINKLNEAKAAGDNDARSVSTTGNGGGR